MKDHAWPVILIFLFCLMILALVALGGCVDLGLHPGDYSFVYTDVYNKPILWLDCAGNVVYKGEVLKNDPELGSNDFCTKMRFQGEGLSDRMTEAKK